MNKKLVRLSYNQLLLLSYLLGKTNAVVTVSQISRETPLKKKVLGGVLSSLSRTKFRGISLIEPRGKAREGGGLRWKLNTDIMDVYEAKKAVAMLLRSYR